MLGDPFSNPKVRKAARDLYFSDQPYLIRQEYSTNIQIRRFTRRPLTSLPLRRSFRCLETLTGHSPNFATCSKSSVITGGQLIFRCSNPSVCITAAKKEAVSHLCIWQTSTPNTKFRKNLIFDKRKYEIMQNPKWTHPNIVTKIN